MKKNNVQVFIVMVENCYGGNEHSVWCIERVFSTKESAIEYVNQNKKNGSDVEYDIETEHLYD